MSDKIIEAFRHPVARFPEYIPLVSNVTAPVYVAAGVTALVISVARTIFHAIAAIICKIKKNFDGAQEHYSQLNYEKNNIMNSLELIGRGTFSLFVPIVSNIVLYFKDQKEYLNNIAEYNA